MSADPTPTPPESERWVWDEVFLHARREAWIILGFWAAALAWCVPVCYWLGYERPDADPPVQLVLGMPHWLFWGVVVPWLVAIVASAWFCFRVMKDDPLDVDPARMTTPDPDHPANGEAN